MAWQHKYYPLTSTQKALFQSIVQEFQAAVLTTTDPNLDLTLTWDRWDRTVMEAVRAFFADLRLPLHWKMVAASRPISIRIYNHALYQGRGRGWDTILLPSVRRG